LSTAAVCALGNIAWPIGREGQAWLRRSRETRAVRITPKGWDEFKRQLGIDADALAQP